VSELIDIILFIWKFFMYDLSGDLFHDLNGSLCRYDSLARVNEEENRVRMITS